MSSALKGGCHFTTVTVAFTCLKSDRCCQHHSIDADNKYHKGGLPKQDTLTFSRRTQGTPRLSLRAWSSSRNTCRTSPELCISAQEHCTTDALSTQSVMHLVLFLASACAAVTNMAGSQHQPLACQSLACLMLCKKVFSLTFPCRPCRRPARLTSIQGKPAVSSSVSCG